MQTHKFTDSISTNYTKLRYIGQFLILQYVIVLILGYAKRSKIVLQNKNYEDIVADSNVWQSVKFPIVLYDRISWEKKIVPI